MTAPSSLRWAEVMVCNACGFKAPHDEVGVELMWAVCFGCAFSAGYVRGLRRGADMARDGSRGGGLP